ncbi:hypothetical protein KI387_031578, partial [Taxus chinensis]
KEKSIRESESHTDIEPHLNITPTSEALKYTDVDLDLAGKNVYAHENKSETMEMKLDAVGHDGVAVESDNEVKTKAKTKSEEYFAKKMKSIKRKFVKCADAYGISELETLHTK